LARASTCQRGRQYWKDDPGLGDVVAKHYAGDDRDVEVVIGGVLQAVGGGRMAEAIGQSLPLAIGVGLSPIAIIAVVVLLTSSRARSLGPVFVLGWLLGLVVVGAIVLVVVGPSGASSSGQRTRWVSWVMIVLGVLLLVEAVRRLRGRTGGGEEVPLPAWIGAIDQLKPAAALGGGVVLGGVRPRSLLLVVGGAAAIAQTGIAGGQQAIAYAVFAVIATIGVGAPVVIYFAMGTRSAELLGRLKAWMRRHNAVILAVVLVVIGVTLIGDGIGGLAS
jgi:Sap, sulfolipid-1-addressing protein